MADYYVRNSGSDSADGLSDANAWATVGKVNSTQFSPLDVIQFRSGDVWREKFTIPQSHSGSDEDNKVLFTSYGLGSRPIISGAEIELFWTQEGDYFFAPGYENNPGVVVKNGVLLKRMYSVAKLDDEDSWWYDSDRGRVYILFNPTGHVMEISSYSRRWVVYVNSNVHDVIIDDICIRDGCRGVYVYPSASDITLQGLTVKNHADWGVNISPKTNVLDCNISYIHDPGIKQAGSAGEDASGYRIAGNEISWCGYYMCTYCQGSAIVYSFSNVIIEHNDIHHCGLGYTQSWGMDHGLKLRAAGSTVRYNRVHHNTAGIGIVVGGSNMDVHHNKVWANGVGISHGYLTTGCKINNNILFKNRSSHGDSCGFLINDGVVAEFKNNLLYRNGNSPYSKQIWFRMGGTDDILDCDYNLIYGPEDPNADICRRVGTGYNWAEWQAAGYDEHSINTPDHGMVDPDNEDFTIKGEISMAIIKLIITEIPNFEVVANPTERTVQKGGATSYEITLDTEGGFSEVVTLSISGVPAGVVATFTPATIQPGESSILDVLVASDAVVGEYEMEVTAIQLG